MTEKTTAEVIQVPNMLKLKVGGRGGIDMAAIAKAEAALKSLSGNFGQWLNDEIVKLEAARQAVKTEGLNAQTVRHPVPLLRPVRVRLQDRHNPQAEAKPLASHLRS